MVLLRSKPILLFIFFLLFSSTFCLGDSSMCLTAYKLGGSQALLQSPECPHWKLHNYGTAIDGSCQTAMHRGREDYQEDRTLCALDLLMPFPGKKGTKEVSVGIAAVFDGHNGAEASHMASSLFLDYFSLHTHFLSEESRSAASARKSFDDSSHLEILKEALLRTVKDIDAAFSEEAYTRELISGSTAEIVLMVDGKILEANVGDSKAFLCSEKILSPLEARANIWRLLKEQRNPGDDIKSATSRQVTGFVVKELAKDHQPDGDKIRAEAKSSDLVLDWTGIPRVTGQLPHSIGDVSYKRYGGMSTPEVMDWKPLTAKDKYLVATSNSVFEKMSQQDVCDLLWEEEEEAKDGGISLADLVVSGAFEKGTIDNLAAIVVPLWSKHQATQEDGYDNGKSRRDEEL